MNPYLVEQGDAAEPGFPSVSTRNLQPLQAVPGDPSLSIIARSLVSVRAVIVVVV